MEEKSKKMEENSSKTEEEPTCLEERKLNLHPMFSHVKTENVKVQTVNTQTITKTKNSPISVKCHRNAVACSALGGIVAISTPRGGAVLTVRKPSSKIFG